MEEDDMDFTPTHSTSSKLASLFGINKTSSATNSSLIYTPPKQPRKEASPSRTPPNEANKSNKLDIILAKGVQAYKMENGSYIGQGTVGITIIGSYASHIYQIIIYKGNKQHMSKTRISRSFTFTIADNNYASFYDDAREIWSVMFNSSSDIQQFAKQIAVSKLNSQTEPLSDLLIQDLSPISSSTVQLHNSVDVNYSYSIITSDEISQPKEKSSKNYQLTESNNVPWLKGLIGCSEKCKRAIILPHSLSVTWTSQIPSNSNIILEIEIEKIYPDEKVSSSSKTSTVESTVESPIDSSAEESTIKARGVCIKEALSNTKTHKANLISRMARMGQATLPLKGAIPCGPSDSEEESSISSSPKATRVSRVRTQATLPTVQPSHVQDPGPPINQSVAVYQNDLTWQQQQMMRAGVPLPYQQLIPVSTTPLTSPTSDAALSVYLSESRTQATELRMGITKVSDKVDQVLNKLQNLNVSSVEQTKTSQPPTMDPTGILTSIQTLVAENESLKSKVEEQKGKIELQNDRIYNLLELNSKYLEQNSASQTEKEQARIQTESDNHKKVKTLEDELGNVRETNKNLQEEIATVRESNKNLQDEIDRLKSSDVPEKEFKINKLEKELLEISASKRELEEKLLKTNELLESNKSEEEKTIESLRNDVQTLRKQNQELQTSLENQKINIVDNGKEQKEIEELKIRIKQLTEEKQIVTSKLQEKSDIQSGNDSLVDDLKRVMNGTYSNLKGKFEDDKEYLGSKIKLIIGSTIRDVTLEYLEMKQQNNLETSKPIIKKEAKEEAVQQETKLEIKPVKEKEINKLVEKKEINKPVEEKEVNKPVVEEKEINKPVVEEKEITKPVAILKNDTVPTEKPKVEDGVPELNPQEKNEMDLQDNSTEESNLGEDISPKESITKSGNKSDQSYDQRWRTNTPPPVPLFEDDDDEDDWLK